MKRFAHIIPVGHTKETLMEGMRQYPFHKVVLLLGKELSPGEERAREIADEMEEELSSLAEVRRLHVDLDSIYDAAIDIAKAIAEERKAGYEVLVNASGSLRTIGISSYLACALTRTRLYVAVPAYESGRITGIRKVVEVPLFPVKEIGEEELLILQHLQNKTSVSSLTELIEGVSSLGRGSSAYNREKARMSYHVKKLREEGLIEAVKKGKNLHMSLTPLGRLYCVGKGLNRG